jgi:hypothetical protein
VSLTTLFKKSTHSRSFADGNSETVLLHVVAVVDPISEHAQQWSSLLQVRH